MKKLQEFPRFAVFVIFLLVLLALVPLGCAAPTEEGPVTLPAEQQHLPVVAEDCYYREFSDDDGNPTGAVVCACNALSGAISCAGVDW